MRRVLLILGTPGAGKTTLAKGLSRKLGHPMVDIGVLVKKEKLYRGYDKARKTYVIDPLRVKRWLQSVIEDGDTILATHFIGNMIPSRWVKVAIVLRLDPLVLYRRLRSKAWSQGKVWENVESELVDVCMIEAVRAFGKKRVFEINTTSKSRERVLSEAEKIVKEKNQEHIPWVDWLSKYDPVILRRRLGRTSST
jgi:adenylate kinase